MVRKLPEDRTCLIPENQRTNASVPGPDRETRVQQDGGQWRVINDLDRLERLFRS